MFPASSLGQTSWLQQFRCQLPRNYPLSRSWQLSPAAEAEVAVVLLPGGLATVQQTGAEVAAEAGVPSSLQLQQLLHLEESYDLEQQRHYCPAGSTDATS